MTEETIKELVIDALLTDEAHHKQWYLEKILVLVGFDIAKLHAELLEDGYDWEPGIAP